MEDRFSKLQGWAMAAATMSYLTTTPAERTWVEEALDGRRFMALDLAREESPRPHPFLHKQVYQPSRLHRYKQPHAPHHELVSLHGEAPLSKLEKRRAANKAARKARRKQR